MVRLGQGGAPQRFDVEVSSGSHFAWLRTRLSLDRTLMAWVRTAIGSIGFGFTIVQFFARFSDMAGVAPAINPMTPQYVGLGLIGAGILSLAIAIWQYQRGVRYLWSEPYRVLGGISADRAEQGEVLAPALALAILLTIVGVFAFAAVLFRMI
ncbi:MAG: DUF202 domain-containing protein [Hyphomicrobiales bacterium]|nr:DUF202 domain-containing protein [Hyphomicrobiales bacterium]